MKYEKMRVVVQALFCKIRILWNNFSFLTHQKMKNFRENNQVKMLKDLGE